MMPRRETKRQERVRAAGIFDALCIQHLTSFNHIIQLFPGIQSAYLHSAHYAPFQPARIT